MNPFSERREFLTRLRELKTAGRSAKVLQNQLVTCPACGTATTQRAMGQNLRVCPSCGHHLSVSAYHRLKLLLDSGSFVELCSGFVAVDPLGFPGYADKLQGLRTSTGLEDTVVAAKGCIDGERVVICVMDSRFLMGSMGSACGEKITQATEYATRKRLPLVIFCASGGARMQEGILSLMQMAKTAAAIERHSAAGLLYISVLTHPTTGGVTASFASLGDIILAEPQALVGFAGPRVIEQTIKQKLPEGFQRAEYLLEHGFVDAVVPRHNMKHTIATLLKMHNRRAQ